jgi:hypothetical protein
MRILFVTAAAALTVGALSAGAALAQAKSSIEISGPLGAMTCSDFTALSPTAQADAVKKLDLGNATGSVTSNSGASATDSTKAAAGTAATAGTPLTEGQLVAACQAAKPASTVHDAYAAFTSGTAK